MTFYDGVFHFFSLAAALAALGLLFSKNVLNGALSVIACLLAVAALYVLSLAEFVAVTQILIYAGGILVVIVFGIMLTAKTGNLPLRVQHKNVFTGFLLAAPLLAVLIFLLNQVPLNDTKTDPPGYTSNQIQNLGVELMTTYLLPFEIAGVLLLIALIGAAVIASHKPLKS